MIVEKPAYNGVPTIYVEFESNGKLFTSFYSMMGILFYATDNETITACQNMSQGQWTDEAYRTLRFKEPPTGRMLEWLQANAVQQ